MAKNSERGAVAVEFAIVLPVLVLLIMGIAEFGRAYNTQLTLTNAAREGARVMAITQDATAARGATKSSAALIPALKDEEIVFGYQTVPASTPAPTRCAAGRQVTATINYTLKTMTSLTGPIAMKGAGTMQCGG